MNFNPAIISNLGQSNQAFLGLEAIPLDKPPYNEDWLQNLIHAHPNLIPASEIEACFDNLVPVLREFNLPSSCCLDNFYITPEGYPVLVEVKLWKNQEARRKVMTQILEYAKDFAALSYEDLNREIRKQIKDKKWGANPLHEIVSAYTASAPTESIFVDRVSKNLREGRFLLLVLGDGIRAEMAALADYLMHHSLRYAFGMIEIGLFNMPDGSVLALPRVLAKTQTIERHVTVISTQGEGFTVKAMTPVVSERVEKTSLSTDEFYDLMGKHDPASVLWFKEFLHKLSDLPIDVQSGARGESLMLKTPMPNGSQLQLMLITPTTAEFWGVPNKHWKHPAWQNLARRYLEKITDLLPGATIKEFSSGMDIRYQDKYLPLQLLHGKTDGLTEAMRQVIRDASEYFSAQTTET